MADMCSVETGPTPNLLLLPDPRQMQLEFYYVR
jgi:hypothetical protein